MSSPDPQATGSGGFALEDVLEILERRRWWIVLAAVLGLALGGLAWYLLPPRYTAYTTILVEPQEVPESFVASTVTLDVEARLRTLHERVTSYANLTDLIERIGKDRLDPSGDQKVEQVMNDLTRALYVNLKAQPGGKDANVVEISFTDDDPEVARDVAAQVASTFITENLKDRTKQAESTAEFLDRELERVREDMEAAEERVKEFQQQRMGTLPSQLETNLRSLDRMQAELSSNLEAQAALQQRLSLLQSERPGSPGGSYAPDPGSAAAGLLDARQRLREAENIYTPLHPNVVSLRELVETLEEEAKREAANPRRGGAIANPAAAALRREIGSVQVELASRKRQEERLRRELDELQERVESTPEMEQELVGLTRDYETLAETYDELLDKRFAAAMSKNLEAAQKAERFNVLRPAQLPREPSFPNPVVVLPAGIGLGLFVVAALIALFEFRNPAFRSVGRLTRGTGLPVVASVPTIDNDRIYEDAPSGDVDPRLVVYTAPESAPAEQYRTFLPTMLEDPERQVVLVTSAARGDGKSLSCMNLALTFACDLNRRVLLIDGDMRRPTAHRLLRIRPQRGLVDVLRRQATLAECAVQSRIPNLTLLPAGRPTRNPLMLLTDPAFLELLELARKDYDFVFIDSPPMLPVVDTRFLRNVADFVLFVVRADATPRDAVLRSMAELREVGGLVFNQVSPGSFRRYYYYDAYSRYAYGDPADGSEDSRDA